MDRQPAGMSAIAAPPSKRQLVGYNNFKRSNPLTDKFKVRTTDVAPRLLLVQALLQLYGVRQVYKFHHIDWWCADATSTHKRCACVSPWHSLVYSVQGLSVRHTASRLRQVQLGPGHDCGRQVRLVHWQQLVCQLRAAVPRPGALQEVCCVSYLLTGLWKHQDASLSRAYSIACCCSEQF